MKKLTLPQFNKKINKEVGWNAAIGFWHEFIYELYIRDKITIQDAMDRINELFLVRGI